MKFIFFTRFECSLGAVHSVVFGGFSATALRDRIIDASSEIVVCGDWGLRGGTLQSYFSTVRLKKLTVVFEYYEAKET